MTQPANIDHEKECARLETVIANALEAMDGSRYGEARTILKTGKFSPPTSGSRVLAFPGLK